MADSFIIKKGSSGKKLLLLKNYSLTDLNFTISGVNAKPSLIYIVNSYINIPSNLYMFAYLKEMWLDINKYEHFKDQLYTYDWAASTTYSRTSGFVKNAKVVDTSLPPVDEGNPEMKDMPASYSNVASYLYENSTKDLYISIGSPYGIPPKSLYDIYIFY